MHEVNKQNYEADVVDASRTLPVLVDVWGPRCGPCLAMLPWVEQLAHDLADSVKVVKLNSAENRRWCIEMRVMSLPTFLLYRDGAEVGRLVGDGCTPTTIAALLRDALPSLGSAPALASV